VSVFEPRDRRRLWSPIGGGIALLGIVLLATVLIVLDGDDPVPGIVRDPAPSVTGLSFIESSGSEEREDATLTAPDGGLSLVYFGFLSCPDVCPMTMADIGVARQRLPDEINDRIEVAYITLDPDRDDGPRMLDYLDHFFDDGYRALRAPDDASLRTAAERLGVTYEIEPHEPDDRDYGVTHSAITYLVDDEGTVVRELPFGVSAEEFVTAIEASLPDA